MKEKKECRICGKETIEYLDLGKHPLADAFLKREDFNSEKFYPLTLRYCQECSLSQLGYVVSKEELFGPGYPYETGGNAGGVAHFKQFARSLIEKFGKGHIVDIGSNDGTLLEGFERVGCTVCGIEPVKQLAEKALVFTIPAFFNSEAALEALHFAGEADIITATNVFAHIDDLHEFMHGVALLLAKGGVFVIEAPYFGNLVQSLYFDTIYHEHLSYLSIKPLSYLFDFFGMEIFDVWYFPIHCGSVRYCVARKGERKISGWVRRTFEREWRYYDFDRLQRFAGKVAEWRRTLRRVFEEMKKEGKRIVGVSAPAKGNTLLNYCGIGSDTLDYITETSEKKIGLYTPGTHIEVVPDDQLLVDQPDYAVILAHNWAQEIKKALRAYHGTWIVPTKDRLVWRGL